MLICGLSHVWVNRYMCVYDIFEMIPLELHMPMIRKHTIYHQNMDSTTVFHCFDHNKFAFMVFCNPI